MCDLGDRETQNVPSTTLTNQSVAYLCSSTVVSSLFNEPFTDEGNPYLIKLKFQISNYKNSNSKSNYGRKSKSMSLMGITQSDVTVHRDLL